jgi:predicted TIM-barrel fold metal-dependent hydrolase
VHEAHQRGVTHIVVTNPLGIFTHMTFPAMQQAVRDGAYFEFIYNSVIGDKPQNTIQEYAAGLKRIGPEHCIIATDFGAVDVPNLPFHPQALLEFMEALREQGISVGDINLMAKTNPARLLGLEP